MGSGIVPPRPPPETIRPPVSGVCRQLALYEILMSYVKFADKPRRAGFGELMGRMENCKAHVPAEAVARAN